MHLPEPPSDIEPVADDEQLLVYLINRARHNPAAYQAAHDLPVVVVHPHAAREQHRDVHQHHEGGTRPERRDRRSAIPNK